MNKHITIIANWKMYLSLDATITYATDNFDALAALTNNKQLSLFLAPTLPAIPELAAIFKGTNIHWCAQDCSEHMAGPYTGQISTETLKTIGCHACITGHSERRKYNGETNECVANKIQTLLDYAISPIICIGEQEEDFAGGRTIVAIEHQLKPIIAVLATNQHKVNGLNIYLAYEPVWSIGTNKIANNTHLETVYTWLFQQIKKTLPAINLHLLYGGSVNEKTATFLKKCNYIEGFLIGKASLDFPEFEKIIKCIMLE